MATQVNITYFGMDGTGRTVTEAKKDAGSKIESAMKGSYEPTLLESRGHALLVWRDPFGWRSTFIHDPKNGFRSGNFGYRSGEDFNDEIFSALSDLAQNSWDGKEKVPPCLTDEYEWFRRLTSLEKRRLLSDFSTWRGFQLAYRFVKANNTTEGDCDFHRWACEHASEFENKEIADDPA